MKKPNIIILNPDEMRCDTMGHMGNPAAATSHLDAFAREEAVSFSRAYCQNPVCVPSRCSFLTGLYPHTRGHRTMQYLLHPEETSLFRELKEAGYYVWMNARNDLVAGQIPGLVESHASEIHYSVPHASGAGGHGHAARDFPYAHFGGEITGEGDKDWADTLAAVERIRHPAVPDKPLCLFLGWNNPHPPYQAEPEYLARIDRAKLPPRIRFSETQGKSRMLCRLHELEGLEAYPEERWALLRRTYLAQCAKVDAMFATVTAALREAGIYDDSAIFFLSDHGDFCGDYDLAEKAQNSFEDCLTRVPLLIKPPKGCGVDPGITGSLAELVDFYATAMDYAGVTPGQDHFGRSLRPIIEDRRQTVRRFAHTEGGRRPTEYQCDEWHADSPGGPRRDNPYWAKKTAQLDNDAHEKGAMVCDGRYKYIRRQSGRDELYDLEADPGECRNLFGSGGTEGIVSAMRMELLDWYMETCDVVPRVYDSRFTEEGLLAMAQCPPELETIMRTFIRREKPGISRLFRYLAQLQSENNAE